MAIVEGIEFHPLWLRDNCPCAECRHESGQRLLDTRSLPDDLAVVGVDGCTVSFSDGHESVFDPEWLRTHAAAPAPRPRRLWGAEIQDVLPVARYHDVAAGGAALREWLAAVDELGFAILTGGPTEPETVTRVAELFGFVRETNYGRLFDVRTVVNPTNLAYTGLGLGAHTDNPYRDPTPTLQLLHCLASSAEGGENTLVDAFRVAQDLPRDDFDLLTQHAIRFRYADGETDLEAETPVISLDARGDVHAVHYNTRSAQPFRLPADLVGRYYEAYQRFGRMLEAPEYRVQFKLGAGDLFIVENLRVMHGRTGYAPSGGERHLQGCYADRDGLFRMFREYGSGAYLGEPVSMTEHMLQSAYAAEQEGAEPRLVAAALLHDYGHFIHEYEEDAAQHGIDTQHEEVGHAFLSEHFGPEVAEPIRMHVAAKRYLCATDPSYLDELSPASILSLELQGGPYSPDEIAEFERSPHAADAVRLRRWDDVGKVAGLETPDLEHYRPALEAALRG
jgi:gamma-butyrobetaine dioxygenase